MFGRHIGTTGIFSCINYGYLLPKPRLSRKASRPLQNAPFCTIPVSGSNFNPRNTQCIPVVKIFAFLELEQNLTFFKGVVSLASLGSGLQLRGNSITQVFFIDLVRPTKSVYGDGFTVGVIITSMRRLMARPWGVSLDASGLTDPYPTAIILSVGRVLLAIRYSITASALC
jgi:hypothetical protein